MTKTESPLDRVWRHRGIRARYVAFYTGLWPRNPEKVQAKLRELEKRRLSTEKAPAPL